MNHSLAMVHAQYVIDALAPACAKIEVAGSLRRGKPNVKDIEIVCQIRETQDLLGESVSDTGAFEAFIAGAIKNGVLAWDMDLRRNGDRYKRFVVPGAGIAVDLFIAKEGNYGNTLAIRTGDAEFSRLLVTHAVAGGLMPRHHQQKDGYLWSFQDPKNKMPERLSCPTEESFFAALGLQVPDLPDRTAQGAYNLKTWRPK